MFKQIFTLSKIYLSLNNFFSVFFGTIIIIPFYISGCTSRNDGNTNTISNFINARHNTRTRRSVDRSSQLNSTTFVYDDGNENSHQQKKIKKIPKKEKKNRLSNLRRIKYLERNMKKIKQIISNMEIEVG